MLLSAVAGGLAPAGCALQKLSREGLVVTSGTPLAFPRGGPEVLTAERCLHDAPPKAEAFRGAIISQNLVVSGQLCALWSGIPVPSV